MARRAQSGLKPAHLISMLALLAGIIGGGWSLLHRGTDPMTGLSLLSTEEYLESSNALSGNTYKLEGTIDNRLDSWKGSDRLFSVQVSEGGISFQTDGSLKLDGARFDKAASANFAATAAVIGAYGDALKTTTTALLATNGVISSRSDGLSSSVKMMSRQIDSFETRLTSIEKTYRACSAPSSRPAKSS